MTRKTWVVPAFVVGWVTVAVPPQQPPLQTPPQQPSEVTLTITGSPGTAPHFAVPDLLPLTNDADTVAASKTIGQVLWDDLRFEREFDMIPRDTYASVPVAKSATDVPFDRWLELGADGLVIGSVRKVGTLMRVEVRLYQVQTGRVAFSKQYDQSAAPGTSVNLRLFAHTISDEILMQQRNLRGVARTKIAFDSNRDAERMGGTIEERQAKEIYICDYDGANQRRITVSRTLSISPNWSPDGRAIAYTSYAGGFPEIFVSFIYQGLLQRPTQGYGQNFLPAYSPDGSRIAFMSDRDGNDEIYVMNPDGTHVQRLTHNPAIDSTPTWSPTGLQIAFTSDRTGAPQIWVMNADGTDQRQLTRESYCDRPTWSPAPFNEIAYASRTSPAAFDIKILDLAKMQSTPITFGEGSNESPAYAPNGRHLVFTSTRGGGRQQLYTIGRDGRDLWQITRTGSNFMPNWSH